MYLVILRIYNQKPKAELVAKNMKPPIGEDLSALLSEHCTPLHSSIDLNPLIEAIGDAQYVLLGEASHGTHEYYTWRSIISQRLIEEKGFSFIGVEGDWPDCYRLNRYIKNYPEAGNNANEVLRDFQRWPTWMWANWEIVALAEWLKKNNAKLSTNKKVGFYGLDIYSLHESMESIAEYLKNNDPKTLQTAMKALHCFNPFRSDEGRSYARAQNAEYCTTEINNLLSEIQSKIAHYNSDPENVFCAEQNALVAVGAEKYYRTMMHNSELSWNIRDMHMHATINRLMHFHGKKAKTIIWEHNTHIGDARATNMAAEGMVNVGQLLRQQEAKNNVYCVGFGSYQGSVIAGRSWGDTINKITMPKAQKNSWEHLLHHAGKEPNKLLLLDALLNNPNLQKKIGHRAIGVVYHPDHEQYGNYVPTILPQRYNAFIFIDETKALHPLHIHTNGHQMPETFPFGV